MVDTSSSTQEQVIGSEAQAPKMEAQALVEKTKQAKKRAPKRKKEDSSSPSEKKPRAKRAKKDASSETSEGKAEGKAKGEAEGGAPGAKPEKKQFVREEQKFEIPDLPKDKSELQQVFFNEKRKRDESNFKIRELIGELRLLRDERDKINSEISQLKNNRNESRNKGREVLKQAKNIREIVKTVQIPRGLPSEAIARQIRELDFRYQTTTIPFAEEKRIVKKIEELKKLYRAKRIMETSRKNLNNLSGQVDNLFSESDDLHKQIIEKAAKSEATHTLYIQKIKEIESLRKKSNQAHFNVIYYAKALGDTKELEEEERKQKRAEQIVENEKLMKERAEGVKATVTAIATSTSGKKTFNFRDLQVLGAVGEDFSLEKIAKSAEESEEEKPEGN